MQLLMQLASEEYHSLENFNQSVNISRTQFEDVHLWSTTLMRNFRLFLYSEGSQK